MCICGTVHPYENMVDYMYRKEDEDGVDVFSLSNYTSVFYANLAKTSKQQKSLFYGLRKRLRFTVAKKGRKF